MLTLSIVCAVLVLIIIGLIIKIVLLHQSMDQIVEELNEKLNMDTNTLITINLTDRHTQRLAARLNIELKELRKQKLKLQSGNVELKESVTNITHDLRTPLTAICGYLDLLEREDKSEQVNQYLSVISGRVNALKALTEELFRYSISSSRVDQLPIEEVDIKAVLEESIAAHYAMLIEHQIQPNITLSEDSVIRQLNKAALLRIFANLISNVIKYSDGDLNIELSDSGIITFMNKAEGLDSLQVERLFHRYYTVETAKESTGLGLSIAQLLTERMGGTITADYVNQNLMIQISFAET